jgi:hypothetical protein|nr:MAG TPA: major capsid protein [Caudoviricetes sp.]
MATTNNNLPVRVYSKQFLQLLSTVYQAQSVFMPTFGALQALDGVQNNATAFSVKTNDMAVVVGEYSTDANTAFGTGTAKSSRFGEMKEVIYADTDVPYTAGWAIHEGLDQMTVNNDLDAAVADRLNLQAQAKTRLFNVAMGKALAAAGTDLGAVSDVNALFESAVEKYTDLEVIAPVRAYVTATVYNAIIDLANVTTSKNSAVNIDTNGMVSFRGIAITKVPTQYMGGKAVIFAPDNVARVFTGINIARTIQAIDFAGVELQGAGKYGTFILDDNKKAIFAATPKA